MEDTNEAANLTRWWHRATNNTTAKIFHQECLLMYDMRLAYFIWVCVWLQHEAQQGEVDSPLAYGRDTYMYQKTDGLLNELSYVNLI